MSKHIKATELKKTGTLLVALGAMAMVAGSQGRINANVASLSGQGAYMGTQQEAPRLTWTQPETLLAAAPESTMPFGVLAFGMLMALVGFGIHAWIVLRERETHERNVPIRAATKKKAPRKSRRQAEVIWVERTIRF